MGIAHPNGGPGLQASRPRASGKVIPFGKYLLLERIAVGGMAEVFLAKSFGIEGFEKIIAIKRILPTMAEDHDFIEMFIDEAKIAGHLTHANIVPIYELGKIGDSHYIAMEYVWGKDALQIMNRFRRMRKRPPPAMVSFIGSKICEGLDYAHNKRDRKGNPLNLIHRDVSPQNILVSYEGQVKLIDFGIAKAASRTTKTQAGVLKGKFGYMSPEQVRGLPIDHRSDIFAVGTCLYELLTGERLFLGESDFTTLEKVRNADVQPPSTVISGVPPKLDEIIMKALAREPSDRWQSAGEMQEALQRFLGEQRPPFGTSKLAAWMKTAFASEMAAEKARIDSYGPIGRPSVLGGGAKAQAAMAATAPGAAAPDQPGPKAAVPPPAKPGVPPRPAIPAKPAIPKPRPPERTTNKLQASQLPEDVGPDDFEGEATVVTGSPFEAQQDAEPDTAPQPAAAFSSAELGEEEMAEDPTTVFFSSEESADGDDDGPTRDLREAMGHAQTASQHPTSRPAGTAPPRQPGRNSAPPPPPSAAAQALVDRGSAPPDAESRQDPFDAPAPASSPAPEAEHAGSGLSETSTPTGQRPDATSDHPAIATPFPPPPRRTAPSAAQWKSVLGVALVVGILTAIGAGLTIGGEAVGRLEVETKPRVAARILLDGVELGRTPSGPGDSPLIIPDVPAGSRTLQILAEGFEPVTKIIEMADNTHVVLTVPLEPAPASGAPVTNDGDPADDKEGEVEDGDDPKVAEAKQDDQDEAKEPAKADSPDRRQPNSGVTASPRRPDRRATQEATERTPARRAPRRTNRPTPVRRARAARTDDTGTLNVQSLPWARVFVDGRDTGKDTPVRGLRLPAGSHQIRLRTADGTMHGPFPIQIEAGQTRTLGKRL